MACFENLKNSPRIITIYSKRKQKGKFLMFSVISYKSNTKQYFCQCFSLLLVNELKLIFLPPLQRRKPSDPAGQFFFFHNFSLLFLLFLLLFFLLLFAAYSYLKSLDKKKKMSGVSYSLIIQHGKFSFQSIKV